MAEQRDAVLEQPRQLHPRLPPGDLDLGADGRLEDLREPEREQGEVRRAQAKDQQADKEPEHPARESTEQDPEPDRHPGRLHRLAPDVHRLAQTVLVQSRRGHADRVDDDEPGLSELELGAELRRRRRKPEVMAEQRCRVGTDPHESDMPERELPRVSGQHRPARREDRVEEGGDQDMHDVGVVVRRVDEWKHQEEREESDAQQVRNSPAHQNLPCAPLAKRLPNRPVGLSSRVRVRTTMP